MPPLAPKVAGTNLLRSQGGWNNSSVTRRDGITVGLLSTRTPHRSGNSGGGIPNPSLGIGVTRLAMPRNAAGTYRPRPRVILSADTVTSYITYQGQRTIINPTDEVITEAEMSDAYTRAGINGNTVPHTLTFGSGAHTIGNTSYANSSNLGAQAATEIHFVGNRSGDLTISSYAFQWASAAGTSALTTVTFPKSVGGNLTIGVYAFRVIITTGDVTSALTTVTFPTSVGGNLDIDNYAFNVSTIGSGNATSALTTVTFPASVGGNLTIGAYAFRVVSTVGTATSALTTVTFPVSLGGNLSIGFRAFIVEAFNGVAPSALTTVTFPASINRNVSYLGIGEEAFWGSTFRNATDKTKGVYFPTVEYGVINLINSNPFADADEDVKLGGVGTGAQLNAINNTTPPQPGQYYKST